MEYDKSLFQGEKIMKMISWKLFERAFPFICWMCKAGVWEMRNICEKCGAEETIRPMTKKDYKAEKKRRKRND